jgi:acyl-coenzyme A thioesterase PaaI-like protein
MFVDANWQRARAHFERSAEASWRAGDVRVWGGAVTAPWSSTVDVTAPDGRLVAHGTARCLIFPPVDAASVPPPAPPEPEPEWPTPDPWRRTVDNPAPASPRSPECPALRRCARRYAVTFPRPPIDRLTGTRLVEAEDGRVVFAMPASGWLAQEFGAVFGGAIALLGVSAASAAVQATAEAGTAFARPGCQGQPAAAGAAGWRGHGASGQRAAPWSTAGDRHERGAPRRQARRGRPAPRPSSFPAAADGA